MSACVRVCRWLLVVERFPFADGAYCLCRREICQTICLNTVALSLEVVELAFVYGIAIGVLANSMRANSKLIGLLLITCGTCRWRVLIHCCVRVGMALQLPFAVASH